MFRSVLRHVAMVLTVTLCVLATSVAAFAADDQSTAFQAGTDDNLNLREAAKAGVVQVARITRPRRGEGSVSKELLLAATPSETEPAEVQPPQTEPAEVDKGGEDAEPAVVLPPPDFTDAETAQYSNEGIHLLAPADWEVVLGSFGSIFDFSIPGTEFAGLVQPMDIDQFPGVLAVVLFNSQPNLFIQAMGGGAELIGVDTFMTDQQLPVVKLTLRLDVDGEFSEGAVYLVSPGAEAYGIMGFGEPAVWSGAEPGLDLMAKSVFFDPELITLTTAETGDTPYSDSSGVLKVMLPAGWQIAETDDIDFPLLVINPDFTVTGILGMAPGSPQDEGIDLDALLAGEAGEPDPEIVAEAVATIHSAMDIAEDELVLDESLTRLFSGEDTAVLRFGGEGNFDEDLSMPMLIYLRISEDSIAALLLFGAPETVMDQETAILDLVDSIEPQ